ncbi:glycosyltransferase family 4 protein [Kribbella sandramycini]|uniref:Glycosyltransferase family 4 protein n=1 Tax=Kribbella sandramycini TaxID=60450 RepID=A0A7Y4NZX9_9ACTN|nr:glycosyltransferase family 4 protein [Kribbella sandramycini]MBB6564859.1 glycosyltransferase involved in cell wall biosynthesis [Kribbella sandramycini]NOL42557.1 glycosyltransferase family 4 protein [Kribbella sandramycini]
MTSEPWGNRPLRILNVGLGWASTTGGHTVTRELAIGQAQAGHQAYVWLPEAFEDPGIPNLRLLHPTNPAQWPDPTQTAKQRAATQQAMLLSRDGLPAEVDLIVGHARFTGDLALELRDRYYPNAMTAYVMHMSPEEGSRARHGDGTHADRKAREDVGRMRRADLTVGVGPLIAEESAKLLQRDRLDKPVHELIPGVVPLDPPQYRSFQRRYELLLTGRMDDLLKGGPEAVAVINELRGRGVPAQLSMRGVPPENLAKAQLEVNIQSGNSVRLREFTNDTTELQRDYNGADLFVMPSHHEGFGLVATEAAGAGVPILVDEMNTGVGMFLADEQRVPRELGAGSVVRASSHDTTAWADRVQEILATLPAERERAMRLRAHLITNYSWQQAAEGLVNSSRLVHDGPARSALDPELQNAIRLGLQMPVQKSAYEKPAGERPNRPNNPGPSTGLSR